MVRLEIRGVSKRYGTTLALDSFSLQVAPSERVVIQGPSGCGKSTLLRLIAGLDAPDQGEIVLDGTILSTAGRILVEPERRNTAMVFQDLALWPHMSVYENVAFVLRARGLDPHEVDARVRAILQAMELAGVEGRYPFQLSGGQRQRVALARAVAAEPAVLLLDEPFSSVDVHLKQKLIALLLELHERHRFTLIHVTHDPDEARAVGNRTVLMQPPSGH